MPTAQLSSLREAAIIHVLTVQYTCETVIRLCKYLKCLSKLQARQNREPFLLQLCRKHFPGLSWKGPIVTWKTAIVYSLTSQWSKDKNLFYKIPDSEAPGFAKSCTVPCRRARLANSPPPPLVVFVHCVIYCFWADQQWRIKKMCTRICREHIYYSTKLQPGEIAS